MDSLVAGIAVSLCALASAPHASAQLCPVERASVASGGAQASGGSLRPALSADGRFVAFQSDASDLVPGDANDGMDVFVHDRSSGVTRRVSVATNGGEAHGDSNSAAITGDGRWVAFESDANDLVAGDANDATDVFVHDRLTGVTTLASRTPAGAPGDGASSMAALSADGRFLAFTSAASDLVPGDTNGVHDVFVRELATGRTERVSVGAGGVQCSAYSIDPVLSADGRIVAFESAASELVPDDTNGCADVFVVDRATGAIERASVSASGVQASERSRFPALSADGRFVAFDSFAADLVSGDANGTWDCFVHDRRTGALERVSVSVGGGEADGASYHVMLSADARWVAFESAAANLVPGDANAALDIFVHDRLEGSTRRVSVRAGGGEADGPSGVPAISADGAIVSSWSEAADLVPDDTNGLRDVFVHARACRIGMPECFGDGSGGACPCSNPGTNGAGCASSAAPGAVLAEHGSASVAADDLAFVAHRLPAGRPCLLFSGTSSVNHGDGLPLGDGLRCAGGDVRRLGLRASDASGAASWGLALAVTGGWTAGDVRRFQAWYRDPHGPCGSGSNLSNAVALTLVP